MRPIWGLVIAVFGAVFINWGRNRSEFIIYRLLVARSRLLWGESERVHGFYQIAGFLMIVAGAAMALSA